VQAIARHTGDRTSVATWSRGGFLQRRPPDTRETGLQPACRAEVASRFLVQEEEEEEKEEEEEEDAERRRRDKNNPNTEGGGKTRRKR